MITSLSNSKVKEWTKLKDKKYRDETNTFLVESEHLVDEALKKGVVKELISLENTKYQDAIIVSYEVMKKITNQVTPPNICAVCNKLKCEEVKESALLLDDISDPGNLGTIIRSAVAFGFKNIVLSLHSVDFYNPKVIRSSEGMIFHVNIIYSDLIDFINKHSFLTIYGTSVKNGKKLRDIKFNKQVGIIIGNEGRGMSEDLKRFCNELIYIPMNSACESLNAGVSASIIMYEVSKVDYER